MKAGGGAGDNGERKRAKRVSPDDLYIMNIHARREQMRKEFAINASMLLDRKQMKQIEFMDLVNDHFRQNKVLNDPSDPSSGVQEVTAWEVSRWLKGTSTPPHEFVRATAAVFEVDLDDLIVGMESDQDPNRVVVNQRELSSGKWYWELRGVVNDNTHRKLLLALAEK